MRDRGRDEEENGRDARARHAPGGEIHAMTMCFKRPESDLTPLVLCRMRSDCTVGYASMAATYRGQYVRFR